MEGFEERLSALKLDLKSYGDEIIRHVEAVHSSGMHTAPINLKSNPTNSIKLLQHDVAAVLQEAQENRDFRELNGSEIDKVEKLMSTLTAVSEVAGYIAKCDEKVNDSDIIATAKSIADLTKVISDLPAPNTEIGSGKVCTALRQESQILIYRFQARLRRLLSLCIHVDIGRIAVHKKLEGILRGEELEVQVPIRIEDIWTALTITGIAHDEIKKLLKSIWISVFRPLWKEKKATMPRISRSEKSDSAELLLEAVERDHAKQAEGTVELNADSSVGSCRMPFHQLLEQISHVISFMWTELFSSVEELSEHIARALHSAPVSLIPRLVDTLLAVLPKTESDLAAFRDAVASSCAEFERLLNVFGFGVENMAPASPLRGVAPVAAAAAAAAGGGLRSRDGVSAAAPLGATGSSGVLAKPVALSLVVADLSQHFAHARRKEVLGRARSLVLADYHNTMLASGDALEDDLASAGSIGDPKALLEQSGHLALQALRFESCQVSLAACRLLKLVHEVFVQAAGGAGGGSGGASAATASPAMAAVLYQCARDCLELFMAIVPMRFADVIETVPRMGAVFYNDCCYIAHNTTLITHAYREKLAQVDGALQSNVGLVDFVPRYRSLGERCLARHVDEQKVTLEELVERVRISPIGREEAPAPAAPVAIKSRSAGGLLFGWAKAGAGAGAGATAGPTGGGERGAAGEAYSSQSGSNSAARRSGGIDDPVNDESSAALVVRHLERLGAQWQGVLQESVYERIMGHLLEGVLRKAMEPVLDSDCIAESACSEITRVFRCLQKAQSVFAEAGVGAGAGAGTGVGGHGSGVSIGIGGSVLDEKVGRLCASWRKFCALGDLLEYSLTEIAEWLPRRKFASFTGQEMTQLIKALFDDSDKRKGILRDILEMAS